ncbi:hypothetical protein [Gottschalkia acidurici]|uniref:hypothetical protein n=1 Tax=Clostridium acidurici TaxID=1556 RepID=UPI0003057253|nr:hypothetical protein [Gottschalkia acidurici]
MKGMLSSSLDDNFMKNVDNLKLKDAKDRMGLLNSSNLYSSQSDGIIVSENTTEDSYNIK